ncbi:MAG: hypothetical protein RL095_424 [Verrucomicrobiota bacterium]|jgi:hypothetical protein
MTRSTLLTLPLALLFAACSAAENSATSAAAKPILLEAEAFAEHGGWAHDQQFMDQMGSPYLLAHGLGKPVADATTLLKAQPGRYRLWVRTKDWVAPWGAKGTPGRFQVKLDGQAVPVEFGTEGAKWHWQDGGIVELKSENRVALHDLTGFEGRCDALLFSSDLKATPPDAGPDAAPWRRELLGLPENPEDGGRFDLVVVGGGVAGSCAAVAAAREGLSVALIQDRPVLGGNGSSEVGVRIEGHIHQKPWKEIGNLVAELEGKRKKTPLVCQVADPKTAIEERQQQDANMSDVIARQPGLKLFTGFRVNAADADKGRHLRAVVAQDTRSGRRLRFAATWFADCTGDATIGFLAGAEFTMQNEGHMGVTNPWSISCECKDRTLLSASTSESPGSIFAFPRCPWAVDLSQKPFPGRGKVAGQWEAKGASSNLGSWFWESGYNRHPIDEVELMRDQNLRAMYGAWDALKNVDKVYPDRELAWAAFIAGKRESRLLTGDVVVNGDDFRKGRKFEDAAFPCTWSLDLHDPHPQFLDADPYDPFISSASHYDDKSGKYLYKGPYWAPYRALYSRNIDNLWMAGRNISVDREALGAVRVMRTCGMMGEVVGLAAGIAKRRGLSPRGVYEKALPELQELIVRGVLPAPRKEN